MAVKPDPGDQGPYEVTVFPEPVFVAPHTPLRCASFKAIRQRVAEAAPQYEVELSVAIDQEIDLIFDYGVRGLTAAGWVCAHFETDMWDDPALLDTVISLTLESFDEIDPPLPWKSYGASGQELTLAVTPGRSWWPQPDPRND